MASQWISPSRGLLPAHGIRLAEHLRHHTSHCEGPALGKTVRTDCSRTFPRNVGSTADALVQSQES